MLNFIISAFDEVDTVNKTIKVIRAESGWDVYIIIQSMDDRQLIFDGEIIKVPNHTGVINKRQIPANLVCRNYSLGHQIINPYNKGYDVYILGDTLIENLNGIRRICDLMNDNKIAVTRALGQYFFDVNGNPTRFQDKNTTDFMPQLFIVNCSRVIKGYLDYIPITNSYTTEQCLGDMFDLEHMYIIADEPYPFIEGVKYQYG
jgi:hypothetical protein